jgi:tetratricopeptide (TPR) repeat protein
VGGGGSGGRHGPAVSEDVTVPRQLPAGVRHFTGRADELKTLSGLLDRTTQDAGMVVISSIGGAAGIGKSALAVHWAQRHADRFPGGQLYINLHGFGPVGPPLEARMVVRRFLSALGVPPTRIPADVDAQFDLYRSLLADRRMLVVLDNARDAEQVRPLLPGASGSMALITSRDQLASLIAVEGACPLTLDLLTPEESRELLTRRVGAERLASEQQAVSDLSNLCARLPLALNIAAAHAAVHPQRPLATLVGELRDTRRRLDVLASRDRAADVRAVFSWSYRTLSAEAACMFRLLGVHPGPDISGPAAASLAALDHDQARRALDELAGAHLLTEHVPGRYAFHDLLRDYAAEQAHCAESEAERTTAMHRVLDHYLHTAHAACALLYPDFLALALAAPHPGVTYEHPGDREQALAWYQAEHAVLVVAIATAAEGGFDTHTWQITATVATFLAREGHWPEWFAASQAALAAAQRGGDLAGQANAQRRLGNVLAEQGSYQEAEAHLQQALTLYEALGDDASHGSTHLSLASALDRQNRPAQALSHARRALELYRNASHQAGQAWALNEIGWCHDLLGEFGQALTFCLAALKLSRELGDRYIEASTLDSIGYAYHHLGRHAEAITHYQLALRVRRIAVYRYSEANTLTHLGDTHQAVGDQPAAHNAWHQALDILDSLQHPDADAVRAKLQALPAQKSASRTPPGSWVLGCTWCGFADVR